MAVTAFDACQSGHASVDADQEYSRDGEQLGRISCREQAVHLDVVREAHWRNVTSSPLHDQEPTYMKEMRGLMAVVRGRVHDFDSLDEADVGVG